jgi:hypothetical protein
MTAHDTDHTEAQDILNEFMDEAAENAAHAHLGGKNPPKLVLIDNTTVSREYMAQHYDWKGACRLTVAQDPVTSRPVATVTATYTHAVNDLSDRNADDDYHETAESAVAKAVKLSHQYGERTFEVVILATGDRIALALDGDLFRHSYK